MKSQKEINHRISLFNSQVNRLAKLYIKRHECPENSTYHRRILAMQSAAIAQKQSLINDLFFLQKVENLGADETQGHLQHALKVYAFLMPLWQIWKLEQLADELAKTYDCKAQPRNKFYYWLLVKNSTEFCSLQRLPDGRVRSI